MKKWTIFFLTSITVIFVVAGYSRQESPQGTDAQVISNWYWNETNLDEYLLNVAQDLNSAIEMEIWLGKQGLSTNSHDQFGRWLPNESLTVFGRCELGVTCEFKIFGVRHWLARLQGTPFSIAVGYNPKGEVVAVKTSILWN